MNFIKRLPIIRLFILKKQNPVLYLLMKKVYINKLKGILCLFLDHRYKQIEHNKIKYHACLICGDTKQVYGNGRTLDV